jgi:hypothetical protein
MEGMVEVVAGGEEGGGEEGEQQRVDVRAGRHVGIDG